MFNLLSVRAACNYAVRILAGDSTLAWLEASPASIMQLSVFRSLDMKEGSFHKNERIFMDTRLGFWGLSRKR